jgi:hypothetical protein
MLPDQELGRFVPATAANPLPLCVAFAMATLYTVLGLDSQATREEILQHLCNDQFLLSRLRIVGSITPRCRGHQDCLLLGMGPTIDPARRQVTVIASHVPLKR